MKRRALFAKTLLASMSASVFTAAGWLMGTRTLQMQWQWTDTGNCNPGATCDSICGGGNMCELDTGCAPNSGTYGTRCRAIDFIHLCCSDNNSACRTGMMTHPCGSCAGCE